MKKYNDLKDYDIHYMKGLGALNDKQSKEIFQNPHLYYYELDDFAECGLCGTAAVISPVGELNYNGKAYTVNGGKIGAVIHLTIRRVA